MVQFIMLVALQWGFDLKYMSDFSRAKISSTVNYSGLRNLLFLMAKESLLESQLSEI